jgi:hypothetical protein
MKNPTIKIADTSPRCRFSASASSASPTLSDLPRYSTLGLVKAGRIRRSRSASAGSPSFHPLREDMAIIRAESAA